MTEPTFDVDGYPTEETVEAIRQWDLRDAAACLDFVAAAWHWPDFGVSHDISAHEGYVVHAEPEDRYLRLATGGWSGNEELISALKASMVSALTWRLSANGGLHIFEYPRVG